MGKRQTVLIVHPDAGMRDLIRTTLAAENYRVLIVPDGEAAWTVLQTLRADAAILGLGISGRDSFELARAMRVDPVLAKTRVIMLTGWPEPADTGAGQAVGADYHLQDSFSPLQLLKTIRECLAPRPGIAVGA